MTPKLIGETYMKYPTEKSRKKRKFGLYECQYCGKEWETMVYSIKSGTKSCGCLQKRVSRTHGLRNNRFYATWNNIIKRCTNPKNINYKNYGGRGITVCEEWLDVKIFIEWAESTHPNIEGMTLDRIDNDKGYSPENCTWSDKTTQCINQRVRKDNKSGYVGVSWNKRDKKWCANIRINKISKQIGSFKTKEEAIQARDNYIIENNLPHKLSTSYK